MEKSLMSSLARSLEKSVSGVGCTSKRYILDIPLAMEAFAESHGAKKGVEREHVSPSCPACDGKMRLRENRKNKIKFWSCLSVYCNATQDVPSEWYYEGILPFELEDFVCKAPPLDVGEHTRAPQCPVCGGQTKLRLNKKKNDEFWGCLSYPGCRGTINAQQQLDIEDLSTNTSAGVVIKKPIVKMEIGYPKNYLGQKQKENPQLNCNPDVLKLIELAINTIGSVGAVEKWMATPKIALKGKRPIDVIYTLGGRKIIRELLEALYDDR